MADQMQAVAWFLWDYEWCINSYILNRISEICSEGNSEIISNFQHFWVRTVLEKRAEKYPSVWKWEACSCSWFV